MTFSATILLGAIAGLTIFFGLPFAVMRPSGTGTIAFLNAIATGVLFFLLFDVLEQANAPIAKAVTHHGSWLPLLGLLLGGVGIGYLGLIIYENSTKASELSKSLKGGAKQLATNIALGIGMHNFSEGLAIGGSARAGAIGLALTLIIGFGLHNITEGFGVAAPLVGKRPPWRLLAILGLVAGGPTFLGTIIGYSFYSPQLAVLFLALAAGAIMYVIGELFHVGRKLGEPAWTGWGIFLGFTAGYLTDLLLTAAGA